MPQSSQEIEWSPSPPKSKPTPSQQRLKDIQDALAGKSVSSEKDRSTVTHAKEPLASSKTWNKRPSDPPTADLNPAPQKKARKLPESWSAPPQPKVQRSSSSATKHSGIKEAYVLSSTKDKKRKIAPVFLSEEQTRILQLVQDGESVFYTGSAGTGKSVLLREIIKTMRKKWPNSPDAVAITASTGIAACNIGGVTIHSFSGIGLGIESVDVLVNKVKKNKKAYSRWTRTKVLIIDEVSMVDGDLFDKIAQVGTRLRGSPKPFGGIQLVVTGDFFQLPPVGKSGVKFAFEAKLWSETIKRTFNLTKVFRQTDQEFVDMLNEMRFGCLSAASITRFRSLSRYIEYDDGLGPTELFPRREEVDRANSGRLSGLQTEAMTYTAQDGGPLALTDSGKKMLSNFMAPEVLTLRKDAQVMLIKNTDENLVNGSMGRVRRFVDPSTYGIEDDIDALAEDGSSKSSAKPPSKPAKKSAVVGTVQLYPEVEFILPHGARRRVLVMPEISKVELPSGELQVSRSQLPLILSWAMSIHKSQGQTLDRVKVDLGKVFEKGQAYVALSRATSLEGLQVLNFDPNKVMAHPKVIQWSKTLETFDD